MIARRLAASPQVARSKGLSPLRPPPTANSPASHSHRYAAATDYEPLDRPWCLAIADGSRRSPGRRGPNNLETAKLLISARANVGQANRLWLTPSMLAAIHGNVAKRSCW